MYKIALRCVILRNAYIQVIMCNLARNTLCILLCVTIRVGFSKSQNSNTTPTDHIGPSSRSLLHTDPAHYEPFCDNGPTDKQYLNSLGNTGVPNDNMYRRHLSYCKPFKVKCGSRYYDYITEEPPNSCTDPGWLPHPWMSFHPQSTGYSYTATPNPASPVVCSRVPTCYSEWRGSIYYSSYTDSAGYLRVNYGYGDVVDYLWKQGSNSPGQQYYGVYAYEKTLYAHWAYKVPNFNGGPFAPIGHTISDTTTNWMTARCLSHGIDDNNCWYPYPLLPNGPGDRFTSDDPDDNFIDAAETLYGCTCPPQCVDKPTTEITTHQYTTGSTQTVVANTYNHTNSQNCLNVLPYDKCDIDITHHYCKAGTAVSNLAKELTCQPTAGSPSLWVSLHTTTSGSSIECYKHVCGSLFVKYVSNAQDLSQTTQTSQSASDVSQCNLTPGYIIGDNACRPSAGGYFCEEAQCGKADGTVVLASSPEAARWSFGSVERGWVNCYKTTCENKVYLRSRQYSYIGSYTYTGWVDKGTDNSCTATDGTECTPYLDDDHVCKKVSCNRVTGAPAKWYDPSNIILQRKLECVSTRCPQIRFEAYTNSGSMQIIDTSMCQNSAQGAICSGKEIHSAAYLCETVRCEDANALLEEPAKWMDSSSTPISSSARCQYNMCTGTSVIDIKLFKAVSISLSDLNNRIAVAVSQSSNDYQVNGCATDTSMGTPVAVKGGDWCTDMQYYTSSTSYLCEDRQCINATVVPSNFNDAWYGTSVTECYQNTCDKWVVTCNNPFTNVQNVEHMISISLSVGQTIGSHALSAINDIECRVDDSIYQECIGANDVTCQEAGLKKVAGLSSQNAQCYLNLCLETLQMLKVDSGPSNVQTVPFTSTVTTLPIPPCSGSTRHAATAGEACVAEGNTDEYSCIPSTCTRASGDHEHAYWQVNLLPRGNDVFCVNNWCPKLKMIKMAETGIDSFGQQGEITISSDANVGYQYDGGLAHLDISGAPYPCKLKESTGQSSQCPITIKDMKSGLPLDSRSFDGSTFRETYTCRPQTCHSSKSLNFQDMHGAYWIDTYAENLLTSTNPNWDNENIYNQYGAGQLHASGIPPLQGYLTFSSLSGISNRRVVANPNSETLCYRSSCVGVTLVDKFNNVLTPASDGSGGDCRYTPSTGGSETECTPTAYSVVDVGTGPIQIKHWCNKLTCKMPGTMSNGITNVNQGAYWYFQNGGAEQRSTSSDGLNVTCYSSHCPVIALIDADAASGASDLAAIFNLDTLDVTYGNTNEWAGKSRENCAYTGENQYCSPLADGYTCPMVHCGDEPTAHASGMFADTNAWSDIPGKLFKQGGAYRLACFKTMNPTAAPTMGVPLAQNKWHEMGYDDMGIDLGFTCSQHPDFAEGGFRKTCSVFTADPSPTREQVSFCHPTEAGLAGSNYTYPWMACPLNGCPMENGEQTYCVFGEFPAWDSHYPSYTGNKLDSTKLPNTAVEPTAGVGINIPQPPEGFPPHALREAYEAFYKDVRPSRCGCKALPNVSINWYSHPEVSNDNRWNFCSTPEVEQSSCVSATKAVVTRGLPVFPVYQTHTSGQCSFTKGFTRIKDPDHCTKPAQHHKFINLDVLERLLLTTTDHSENIDLCAETCFTGFQHSRWDQLDIVSGTNTGTYRGVSDDVSFDPRCYLQRYSAVRDSCGVSGKVAHLCAQNHWTTIGKSAGWIPGCVGLTGGCMSWEYYMSSTEWHPEVCMYQASYEECTYLAGEVQSPASAPTPTPATSAAQARLLRTIQMDTGSTSLPVRNFVSHVEKVCDDCAPRAGCSIHDSGSVISVYWGGTPDMVDENMVLPSAGTLRTYCPGEIVSVQEKECVLLTTKGASISFQGGVSGEHTCEVPSLDNSGCVSIPRTSSLSVLEASACEEECIGVCNAFRYNPTELKCELYSCSYPENIKTLPSSSDFVSTHLQHGWEIWLQGYQSFSQPPISQSIETMSSTERQNLLYPPSNTTPLCTSGIAPYYPTLAATNTEEANYRFQETCPDGYTEISTEAECINAGKMAFNGNYEYTWGSTATCYVSSHLDETGVMGTNADQFLATFTTIANQAACAQKCADNWECKGFMYEHIQPTGSQSLWTLSAPTGIFEGVCTEIKRVNICTPSCPSDSQNNTPQGFTDDVCGQLCYDVPECNSFHVTNTNVCVLYSTCSSPHNAGSVLIQVTSLTRNTVSSPPTCRLYDVCSDVAGGITHSRPRQVYTMRRTTPSIENVSLAEWEKYPPGCLLVEDSGVWKLKFNILRNLLSWGRDSTRAHELASAGVRSTPLVSLSGTDVYRRLCTRWAGKTWAGQEEKGASWRTLDYGASVGTGRPKFETHFSANGVDFSISNYHGAYCATGYVPIQTPRQCLQAGHALNALNPSPFPSHDIMPPATRQVPVAMDFKGQTWYLVRHTPPGEWHQSTDNLAGNQSYGVYPTHVGISNSGNHNQQMFNYTHAPFSIPFGFTWTQMLLASGDMSNWVIIPSATQTINVGGVNFDVSNDGCFGDNAGSRNNGWNPEVVTRDSQNAPQFSNALHMECITDGYRSHPLITTFAPSAGVHFDDLLQVLANGQATDYVTVDQARAMLSGSVLYVERGGGNDVISNENVDHIPTPTTGADVWVNVVPSDGFVHPRVSQVPGCSVDAPLSASSAEMRDHGVYWEEPLSSAPHQYGDGLLNFNSYTQWESATNTFSFGAFELEMWRRGDSWLHGHPVCVKEIHHQEMYRKIDQDGKYLLVLEPGWECPSPEYRPIENLDQCSDAVTVAMTKSINVTVNGEIVNQDISVFWVDPVDFVNYIDSLSNIELADFVPGCTLLPSSTTGNIRYFDWDVFKVTNPPSVRSYEQRSQRFTLNPDPNRAVGDTSNFRSASNERLSPLGYSVCVNASYWRQQDPNTTLFIRQREAAASLVDWPVVGVEASPYWQFLTVVFTLKEECQESGCLSDASTWRLPEDTQSSLVSLVDVVMSRITGLGSSHITTGFAATDGTIPGMNSRRSGDIPLSSPYGLVMRTKVSVASHQLDEVLERVRLSFEDKDLSGFAGLLINLENVEWSVRVLQEYAITTDIVFEGGEHYTQGWHESELSGVYTTVEPSIESWSVNGTFDVSPKSNSIPTERQMWWQSLCECEGSDGGCTSQDSLELFEFRISSSYMGSQGVEESLGWTHVMVPIPGPTLLQECVDACASRMDCLVMMYIEVPSPWMNEKLVNGALSRCNYYRHFEALESMTLDDIGGIRVRAKMNACPMVHLSHVRVCHTGEEASSDECLKLTDDYNTENFYIRHSNNASAFHYSTDRISEPSFTLPSVDVSVSAESKCWSHSNVNKSTHVLCQNGTFVQMDTSSFFSYQTNDCTESSASTGLKSSRRFCPPSAPFMCAHRYHYATDYFCAKEVASCDSMGGLRPCGYLSYDLIGVPVFEQVTESSLVGSNEADVETLYMVLDKNTDMRIDSVSRCGGDFVEDKARQFVVFTNASVGTPFCKTGFSCCDAPYSRVYNVSHQCECPADAPASQMAIYNGVFADTCHSPMSVWPTCVHQCVDMGEECQYYMLNSNGRDCLLCHSASGYVENKNWTYHMVQVPVVLDSGHQLSTEVRELYNFFHIGGSTIAGDATLRVEGDWYAFQLEGGEATTCPAEYHTMAADAPSSSQWWRSVFDSEEQLEVHCMRASSAYTDFNPEECPVNAFASVSSQCPFVRLSCSATNCVDYALGCSFRQSDSAFIYHPPGCCDNFTSVTIGSSTPLCRQSSEGSIRTENWMRCSELCSDRTSCSHWAWDTNFVGTEGKRCILFDINSLLLSDTQSSRMKVLDIQEIIYAAPFGYNWLGGVRAPNPIEIGEGAFQVEHARIYRTDVALGALERVHFDTFKMAVSHLVDINVASILSRIETPPLNYYSMFEPDGSGGMRRRQMLDEMWPTGPWFGTGRQEVWRALPYKHPIDTSKNKMEMDADCWHNNITTSYRWEVGVNGCTDCQGVKPMQVVFMHIASPDTPRTIIAKLLPDTPVLIPDDDSFHFSFWMRPTDRAMGGVPTDKNTFLLIGNAMDTLTHGIPTVLYNIKTQLISLLIGNCVIGSTGAGMGACRYTSITIPVSVPLFKWHHISFKFDKIRTDMSVNFAINGLKAWGVPSLYCGMHPDEAADEWAGFGGIVTDTVKELDAQVFRLAWENTRKSTSVWLYQLQVDIQTDANLCLHGVRWSNNTDYIELFNPVYDVHERFVLETDDNSGNRLLADSRDPSKSTFEWQTVDCEPQQLKDGGSYSFEAVFENKIRSVHGFYVDISTSSYTPRWLSVCHVPDVHGGGFWEACLVESKTPVKWKAVYRGYAAAHPFVISPESHPGYRLVIDLQYDSTTTFPEIYTIDVKMDPMVNSTKFVASATKDVEISLASDPTVSLLQARSLSCFGKCPFNTGFDGTHPFSLVRRISEYTVGALYDTNDPKGSIFTLPAVFTNGTESHVWAERGCGWPNSGQIVSLYTGRCLSRTRTDNVMYHGYDKFTYVNCDTSELEDTCWLFKRHIKTHEETLAVTTAATEIFRTASFDDTEMWPHENVLFPPVSKRENFLMPETVTDVFFDLQINPSVFDMASSIVTTPIRFYTQQNQPVAWGGCTGSIYISELSVVPLATSCQSICSKGFASNGNATLWSCQTAHGVATCNPDCFPSPSSWLNIPDTYKMDFEMVQMTVGMMIKKRGVTAWQQQGVAMCMASNTDPQHPEVMQAVECSGSHQEYFTVVEPSVHIRAIWGDDTIVFAKSIQHQMCVGVAPSPVDSRAIMQLVDCSDTSRLLGVRNSLRDDAVVIGHTDRAPDRDTVEAIFKYKTSLSSVTGLYYRRPSGGSIRVVVRFDGGGDLSRVNYTSNFSQTPAVTLVDATRGIETAPSTHGYVVRIMRENIAQTERRSYLLVRNGTIVDKQTQLLPIILPATSSERVSRSPVDPSIATRKGISVNNINVRSMPSQGVYLYAVDTSHNRFGSGTKWRMYHTDMTISMLNHTASDCAKVCQERGDCAATRWSQHTRTCEVLERCSSVQVAAEGQPNTFNLKETPWFLYNKSSERVLGKHNLIPPSQQSLYAMHQKSMILEQMEYGATMNKSATELKYIFNKDIFPNARNIIYNIDQALDQQSAPGGGSRRLMQTYSPPPPTLAALSSHMTASPTMAHTSEEQRKRHWEARWFESVVPVSLRGEPFDKTSSATQEASSVNRSDSQTLSTTYLFPTLLGRVTDDHTEMVCTNAHTFAFAGVFRSTQARYGYRKLMSAASEAGEGGAKLSLSPDGNIKDKHSGVSIETHNTGDCVSIIIIDCSSDYKVSVDGQLKYYMPECPFDLYSTDTLIHAWSGRREAMCFGGDIPLYRNRHVELVAYFQLKHGGQDDSGQDGAGAQKMCWDISKDAGHDIDPDGFYKNRAYVLPNQQRQQHPVMGQGEWAVSTAGDIRNGDTASVIRCKDDPLCNDQYSQFELYKIPLSEHSSPFGLVWYAHNQACPNPPCALLATRSGNQELEWTPIGSMEDALTAPLRPQLIEFHSQVTLDDEKKACGIDELHPVTQEAQAPPCTCEDEGFTPWEPAEPADSITNHNWYNESIVVYDTCGRCETINETHSHPLYEPGMIFSRGTGVTISSNPDLPAEKRIRRTRKRIASIGGCSDWDTQDRLTQEITVSCSACPKDCYFRQMDHDTDMFTPGNFTCSRESRGCLADASNVKSCVVTRRVESGPDIGGRSCTEVMMADFDEISRKARFHGGGAKSQGIMGEDARGVYRRVNFENSIKTGVFVENTISSEAFGLSFVMQQLPVYQAEGWTWISTEMWPYMKDTPRKCDTACYAELCHNMIPSAHVARTLEGDDTNVEKLVSLVLFIFLICALVVACALYPYRRRIKAWCKDCGQAHATANTAMFASMVQKIRGYTRVEQGEPEHKDDRELE